MPNKGKKKREKHVSKKILERVAKKVSGQLQQGPKGTGKKEKRAQKSNDELTSESWKWDVTKSSKSEKGHRIQRRTKVKEKSGRDTPGPGQSNNQSPANTFTGTKCDSLATRNGAIFKGNRKTLGKKRNRRIRSSKG